MGKQKFQKGDYVIVTAGLAKGLKGIIVAQSANHRWYMVEGYFSDEEARKHVNKMQIGGIPSKKMKHQR